MIDKPKSSRREIAYARAPGVCLLVFVSCLSGLQRHTASIVTERLLGGKMRVASNGWDQEGVLPGEQG